MYIYIYIPGHITTILSIIIKYFYNFNDYIRNYNEINIFKCVYRYVKINIYMYIYIYIYIPGHITTILSIIMNSSLEKKGCLYHVNSCKYTYIYLSFICEYSFMYIYICQHKYQHIYENIHLQIHIYNVYICTYIGRHIQNRAS
jgi:hypothetical protein